jgi:hypothetical protein
MIDYLRLAFGMACVLVPGALVARAFGQRSYSAAFAWTLGCVFVAWAVVFAVHSNIKVVAFILLVIAVAALVVGRRRGRAPDERAPKWVLAGGVVLGWFLWHIALNVAGDGLFHEGRVRKLLDFGDLHLRTVDEFKDGGLHPGYAFPLWHGLLALVSWFSGLDPQTVIEHGPAVLAPVACVVAWESGLAVFRSRHGAAGLLAVVVALFCFAQGHGGSFAILTLPATSTRQLMVPAALTLFFSARRRQEFASLAVLFVAITLSHPTYALFVLMPLLAVVWWEWRSWLAAAVPTALALLWLKPIVDETISHNPKHGELVRGLVQYRDQLVVHGNRDFSLAPEVFGRSGALSVAALVLLPVTALALRRRWAQFALGGSLIVLLVMNVPWLFVHLSDAVSLSQSRRAAGFAPLPFALVGALAIVARRYWTLPIALAAGIVLERLWPGDFEYGLRHGGPAFATWIALVGGLAALVLWLVVRPPDVREEWFIGALAAVCLSFPVFVHGVWHWSPGRDEKDPLALSARLVHNLRTKVPKGAIVLAPLQTSYRVVAVAPVYVVGLPVSHVANTKANQPYVRRKAVLHWVATNDPAVARRYGATWAIRNGRLYRLPQ